jgi:hypothetical protein
MGKFFSSKSTQQAQNSGDAISNEAWGISKPLFQQAVTGSGDVLRQILANPAFTGQRVAGLNDIQAGSALDFANLNNNTGTLGALSQFGAGLGNLTRGGTFGDNAADLYGQFFGPNATRSALDTGNAFASSPMADNMVTAAGRDVTRNLFERELPGIDRQAAGTGNINSTRAGVESAIAQRGAADRLADMSTSIRGKLFDTGVNQFNQDLSNALNTNNQLLQAGNFGINAMRGGQDFGLNAFQGNQAAGGLFQAQNQAELDADKAQFDEGQANLLNALKTIAGISGIGSTFDGGASSSSQVNQARPSTAASLGSFLGSFMKSDIRAKENIELVGKTPAGLNIYEFDYKPEFKDASGHGRFRGVMAQEVEQIIPEAVAVDTDGYLMVDYSLVR